MDFPKGQTLDASSLARNETLECDAVVVGTGAGGAAVALQLARAGLSVAMLEEGRRYQPQELATKQSWALRHLYAERGLAMSHGNVYVPLPRGRVVGGSTVINSGICFRTPRRVLEKWQRDWGVEWADEKTLAPVFEEVERTIGVSKTRPDQAGKHSLTFKRGADALGFEGDFIYRNAPGCVGCGLCQLGCPVGVKGSVDRNMVPFAMEKGAALITRCRATQVLTDKGSAWGVEAWGVDPDTEARRRKLTVRAKKVFVCGGAIGSPLLLIASGLWDPGLHIGRHLHVHAALGVAARFEEIIDAWHGATQGYWAWVPGETAVMETFSATPDIFAISYDEYSKPVDHLRRVAACGVLVGDVSEGTVSPGPAEGRSAISYNVGEEDLRVLMKGQREIARAFFAAGAIEVHTSYAGHAPFRTLEALDKAQAARPPVDRFAMYASHPMGTCRMGPKREASAVQSNGEHWRIKGLYVADASIFPSALGVNPQITVMSAATVIARGAAKAG
jgi:choline dehydrogenase-like flavoprotein